MEEGIEINRWKVASSTLMMDAGHQLVAHLDASITHQILKVLLNPEGRLWDHDKSNGSRQSLTSCLVETGIDQWAYSAGSLDEISPL